MKNQDEMREGKKGNWRERGEGKWEIWDRIEKVMDKWVVGERCDLKYLLERLIREMERILMKTEDLNLCCAKS